MKKRGLIIFSSVLVLGVLVFGISSCTNKKSVDNTSVEVITEAPTTEPETEEETEPETTEAPETEERKSEIDREAIIEEWSSTSTSLSDLRDELVSYNVNGSDINEIIEVISTNREHQTQESLPDPTQAPKPKQTEAPKPTQSPTKAPKPKQTEAPTQAPTQAPETQPQTEAPTQAPVMPTAPPETEAKQTEAPTQPQTGNSQSSGGYGNASEYADCIPGYTGPSIDEIKADPNTTDGVGDDSNVTWQ